MNDDKAIEEATGVEAMLKKARSKWGESYRRVVRGYLRLHQLEVEGKHDSADADDVRDVIDASWESLTHDERTAIQLLSAELNAQIKQEA